jgi:hypothetical protein
MVGWHARIEVAASGIVRERFKSQKALAFNVPHRAGDAFA